MKTLNTLVIVSMFGAALNTSATITFGTGNTQYYNVNIAADTNTNVVTGVANGLNVDFSNMIGPDGSTQVTMHAKNGVAFIQSYADYQASGQNNFTGFTSLSMTPQTGYGFSAGDFALDELNSGDKGIVTFIGTDQYGNTTTSMFDIQPNGQNQYQFTTGDGELVTSIVFSVGQTNKLVDLKQVSVDMAQIGAVPEPSTVIAGALLLLPFGISTFRILRKSRGVQ